MAKKIFFITGGARSGKSSFAEGLAKDCAGKRAYIATAQALDQEMAAKIAKHRQDRGSTWDTFEEPIAVPELLAAGPETARKGPADAAQRARAKRR